MARKSAIQIEAESAMQNLLCVHELAGESGNSQATYLRNAGDCARWCASLRKAGVAYPAFMYAAGLNYFGHMWRVV